MTRFAAASRVFCLTLLIGLSAAFSAFPQETSDKTEATNELARKISAAVEEYHALRTERLHLKEHHQQEMEEIETQIRRLKDSLADTTSSLEREQVAVDDLSDSITSDKQAMQATRDLLAETSMHALAAASEVKQRIASGIPYKRAERLATIDDVIDGLKSDDPAGRGRAIQDFWTLYIEDLRLGRSIDLWNEPVLIDGGKLRKNSYQVRLGLIGQFFISEDGEIAGIAAMEQSHDWHTDLAGFQLKQLRAVLAILQERSFPRLTPLPFVVTGTPPQGDAKREEGTKDKPESER